MILWPKHPIHSRVALGVVKVSLCPALANRAA
jgi:hypothetical protein